MASRCEAVELAYAVSDFGESLDSFICDFSDDTVCTQQKPLLIGEPGKPFCAPLERRDLENQAGFAPYQMKTD